MDGFGEFSKAVLTLIIAALAVYIAWQQWRTNVQKLHLDLYAHRLRIYGEVKKFLGYMLGSPTGEFGEMFEFLRETSEADFLFGEDVRKYIEDICKHASDYGLCRIQYRDSTQSYPEDYNHAEVTEGILREGLWFAEQPAIAREKFKPYLAMQLDSTFEEDIQRVRKWVKHYFALSR